MKDILALLSRHRFDLSNEKRTQSDIESVLTAAGIVHEREKRLSGADIVDFLVDGVAIEVKIGGSRREIYRQLCRYAEHEAVRAIILVANLPMTLPPTINGRPAAVAQMGRAWI